MKHLPLLLSSYLCLINSKTWDMQNILQVSIVAFGGFHHHCPAAEEEMQGYLLLFEMPKSLRTLLIFSAG